MRYIVLALLFGLTGCAEFGARAITNATYLAESAEGFVREVHDDRRWIRERCREMLMAEVMELQGEGNFAAAREVLAANYPPLATFQLVRSFREKGSGVNLNHPWGCQASAAVETGPGTPPPVKIEPLQRMNETQPEQFGVDPPTEKAPEKSTVFLSERYFARLVGE